MNKNGFTLVELLAVIVVLAIILVVAIPNVTKLIGKAKDDAYDRQKDLIITVTRNYILLHDQNVVWIGNTTTVYLNDLQAEKLLDNPLLDPRGGKFNSTDIGTKVIVTKDVNNQYTYDLVAVSGYDTTPPTIALLGSSTVTINQGDTYTDAGVTATDDFDGDVTSKIVKVNPVNTETAGSYTITYDVIDSAGNNAIQVIRTVNVVSGDYIASKGVNKPKLITGLTPIKWNGSAWIDTTESDTAWYDYTTAAKQWANAKTADGSMWVWIPRYAYQIATNYHTSTVGTINAKFLKADTNVASDESTVATTATYSGSNQTNYIQHPAFTFGTTELTGMWVAKFEASGTTNAIDIKPNVASLGNTSIGDIFTGARNMETNNRYGWGTTGTGLDTHLLKNIEWGAIAYLAQSAYGKNSEAWINNSSTLITGCAGGSVSASSYAGCQNTYDTANGVKASSTGNIYGIYDMSGGAQEYVAAYVNNSVATTSGYNIITVDSKYKDVYTVTTDSQATNYSNASLKKGDAIYETSSSGYGETSWNSDYSYMPYSGSPFFVRGGVYNDAQNAGFYRSSSWGGYGWSTVGFRVTILIGNSL